MGLIDFYFAKLGDGPLTSSNTLSSIFGGEFRIVEGRLFTLRVSSTSPEHCASLKLNGVEASKLIQRSVTSLIIPLFLTALTPICPMV
jgi:hypothetical protein